MHNISPVFVFVVPLFILGFLAFAPAVYGIGVGAGVGYTALLMRYRRGGLTALIALLWAVTGLALVPYIAEWRTPTGTEFFSDILMPFIGLMIGASVNFEWLAEPKPIDVAPWIVQTVLGISALFWILIAAGYADDLATDESDQEPQQPCPEHETARAVLPGM